MKYLILLVEDDPVTTEFITKLLKSSLSADVHNENNNDAALRYIYGKKPDLIISDIYHCKKGTGVDLFNYVKSDNKISSIPFIVLSGQAKEDIELKLYRSGVKGVMEKPFRSDDFIDMVCKVLEDKTNPDVALLNLGYETIDIDYKEHVDLSKKDGRASLAKDIIAMANTVGGTIIIGVSEPVPGQFERVGISEEKAIYFETTKVGNALRKYIGSVISVSVKRLKWRSKLFVFIRVPSCKDTLAMAYCDNETANLYQGRIYARDHSAQSVEVKDSIQVLRIIDKIVAGRIKT